LARGRRKLKTVFIRGLRAKKKKKKKKFYGATSLGNYKSEEAHGKTRREG